MQHRGEGLQPFVPLGWGERLATLYWGILSTHYFLMLKVPDMSTTEKDRTPTKPSRNIQKRVYQGPHIKRPYVLEKLHTFGKYDVISDSGSSSTKTSEGQIKD